MHGLEHSPICGLSRVRRQPFFYRHGRLAAPWPRRLSTAAPKCPTGGASTSLRKRSHPGACDPGRQNVGRCLWIALLHLRTQERPFEQPEFRFEYRRPRQILWPDAPANRPFLARAMIGDVRSYRRPWIPIPRTSERQPIGPRWLKRSRAPDGNNYWAPGAAQRLSPISGRRSGGRRLDADDRLLGLFQGPSSVDTCSKGSTVQQLPWLNYDGQTPAELIAYKPAIVWTHCCALSKKAFRTNSTSRGPSRPKKNWSWR